MLSKFFALNINPMFFEILLSIVLMWSFHVRFSSKITPINFMLAFLVSSMPTILSIGWTKDRSYLSVLLWHRENTDFFRIEWYFVCFKPFIYFLQLYLFALNHSFIFCDSKFALVKRVLRLLSEINRFESLAKIIEF